MKHTEMRIERRDVQLIALSALGGFLLVLLALAGGDIAATIFVGLVAGAPSGGIAGVLVCIGRRFVGRK